MKRALMGMIMAGAVLSSGCATVASIALEGRGGGHRAGHATTYQQGPVYTVSPAAFDYHSLSDGFGFRPSMGGPLAMATSRAMPDRHDTPLAESGTFGLYVKGLPGANIRSLGLQGYAGSWAESGLGRSLGDMSRDPFPRFVYVQFRILPGPNRRIIMH